MANDNSKTIEELEGILKWLQEDIKTIEPIYKKIARENDKYTSDELQLLMKPFTELIVKQNQIINTIAILKNLPAEETATKDIEKEYQKEYRTRSSAGTDLVRRYPETLIVPSQKSYQYATSLYQEGDAHLIPVPLKMENGKLSVNSEAIESKTTAELQNMVTKELVTNIDITTLQALYSLILYQFQLARFTSMREMYRVYLPDLAEYLGYDSKSINSKQQRDAIINKIKSFHNVTGVISVYRGKDADGNERYYKNYYQVLNFEAYEETTNTIMFSSPYMNNVIKIVLEKNLKKNKDGTPKLTKSGQPTFTASHSYLVDSSISKEKNKAAVENVILIVNLIEQAGNHSGSPHISVLTLIERNQVLRTQFEGSKNRTVVLQRVFKKTWELLRTKTRLQEKYKNIQLPNPNDPNVIPATKTYEKMSFTFKHDGVSEEWGKK